MLYLPPDSPIRLKSFSGASKGTKATIRIELETSDMTEFGYALDRLRHLQAEQKAPPVKPKRLALPKPEAV